MFGFAGVCLLICAWRWSVDLGVLSEFPFEGSAARWQTWMATTEPYVRAPGAYDCPAAREGELGYDFNARLSGVHSREITRETKCVMLWDAGALGPSWGVPDGHGPPRHDRGDNFLFVDGHVEWRERVSNPDITELVRPW